MSKDKKRNKAGHGGEHRPDPPRSSGPGLSLPGTRAELLSLHAETRRRRNAAPLGSDDHRAAVELIGRIEVEIARLERAMDPPRG